MKAKRPRGTLSSSPDKSVQPVKRLRFGSLSPPGVEHPSPTSSFDMFHGEEAATVDQPLLTTNDGDLRSEQDADVEDEPRHNGSPSYGSEFGTSPQSATHYSELEQDDGHDGSSKHDSESSPSTSVYQGSLSNEHQSVHDHGGASAEKVPTVIRDRAVGTLLTDWPAKAGGLTREICDLKALKQFMASDKLNQDHKAMWVSPVQTIVYEPDRNSVLDFIQNTLSGDTTLPGSFETRLFVPRRDVVNLREWAVTGSLMMYGEKKERWSAAHFVDLALWVGGPDAGIQAARALKIFGVWNPSGDFDPTFAIESIGDYLDHQTILRRIWPNETNSQRLLAWANRHRPTPEQQFDDLADAHSDLLRQCIGEDLRRFPSLARDFAQVGDVKRRIISRAYFDSTLAPILRKHFDKDVDLELAYRAVVASQSQWLDRNPRKHITPNREPRPVVPRGNNHRTQGRGRHKLPFDGKGQFDDRQDDSERDYASEEKPIKNDSDAAESMAAGYQKILRTRNVWSRKETGHCMDVIRQLIAEGFNGGIMQELWREVHHRLVIEHNSERTLAAIRMRWFQTWKFRREYADIARHLETMVKNKKDEGNKKKRTFQNDNIANEEAERSANSPSATSDSPGNEIDGAATNAQDLEQAMINEQHSPSRTQAHTGQDPRARVNTRSTPDPEAREKRITNSLYQASRDLSLEVIARFLERGNPSLRRYWNEVSEHRLRNDMENSGPVNAPPFPLVGLSNHSQIPRDSRHSAIENIALDQQEKNIEDDIRKFKRFAGLFLV